MRKDSYEQQQEKVASSGNSIKSRKRSPNGKISASLMGFAPSLSNGTDLQTPWTNTYSILIQELRLGAVSDPRRAQKAPSRRDRSRFVRGLKGPESRRPHTTRLHP